MTKVKATIVTKALVPTNKGTNVINYPAKKQYHSNSFKPPISNIPEYSSTLHYSDFNYRNIVAIEKLKGKSFSIHFDGKNVVFKDYKDKIIQKGDDYLGFKTLFYKKYAGGFIKLVEHLKNCPFTLHGEIVGYDADPSIEYFKDKKKIDIFFYDIYLNTHWMDWGDFSYLMKLYDIQTVSLFYNDVFPRTKGVLQEMANKPNVEGVIIRPIWEDRINYKRLIVQFYNDKFKKLTKEKKNKISKELIGKVRLHMFKEFVNSVVLWKSELKVKKIEIEKKNISEIMKLISKRGMEDIDSHLVSEFFIDQTGKYERSDIRKAMKQELSSLIKIELGINNLTK